VYPPKRREYPRGGIEEKKRHRIGTGNAPVSETQEVIQKQNGNKKHQQLEILCMTVTHNSVKIKAKKRKVESWWGF
jgi:hypothetical protein